MTPDDVTVARVKAALESRIVHMADRVAGLTDPAECTRVLREEIKVVLKELGFGQDDDPMPGYLLDVAVAEAFNDLERLTKRRLPDAEK